MKKKELMKLSKEKLVHKLLSKNANYQYMMNNYRIFKADEGRDESEEINWLLIGGKNE